MAFDFPNSPATGTLVTVPGGAQYRYDGAKWVAASQANVYATSDSPTFTGNPTAPTPASGDNDTQIATTAFVAPAFNDTGRNKLHNPLFNIKQRGAGPFATLGAYTVDRWQIGGLTDTVSFTQAALADADRAAIGDEEAQNALQNVFTGNAAVGAWHYICQPIEDVRRLGNDTVTVSFWAKAAAGTPKLGINILQNFGTGGSTQVYAQTTGNAVTLSTTWTRYTSTIAIPSVSGKTITADSKTYLLFFYSSGATNNATAGNIGVQSGTISLWGVQLEGGSIATPLEKPDPPQDIANCQRFYTQLSLIGVGYQAAGQNFQVGATLPVTMRAVPTIAIAQNNNVNASATTFGVNTFTVWNINTATAAGTVTISLAITATADL